MKKVKNIEVSTISATGGIIQFGTLKIKVNKKHASIKLKETADVFRTSVR